MDRVRADSEHDSNKLTEVSDNKAVNTSTKKVKRFILNPSTPVRRSGRLNGKSNDFPSSTRDPLVEEDKTEEDCKSSDIEQNLQNKAIENGTNGELSPKSNNEKKTKRMRLELGTPRKSERVMTKPCDSDSSTSQENNSKIVENCYKVEEEAKMEEAVSEISEDESIQLARISENKAILASLGLGNSIRKLENLVFPPKTTKKEAKVEEEPKTDSIIKLENLVFPPKTTKKEAKVEEEPKTDNQVTKISYYESIRNARISENKARLESLGIARRLREIQTVISPKTSTKSRSSVKKAKTEVSTPSRRSRRLKRTNSNSNDSSLQALSYESDEEFIDIMERKRYPMSERCASKARGSIYDPVIGICCHFCRQKKLCGEEDCKRCGDRDINQPCIGKTECSVCHSSNGVLCRACLKVRYGEEMEEVRSKEDWMCPHCVEEREINPYWICNSSFCLKRRKMVPTGIAIHQARAEGFKSVAHMIMDKLKQKAMML